LEHASRGHKNSLSLTNGLTKKGIKQKKKKGKSKHEKETKLEKFTSRGIASSSYKGGNNTN
jgi:hypothetical protein